MDRRKFIINSSIATMAFATGFRSEGLASVSANSHNRNIKVGLIGSNCNLLKHAKKVYQYIAKNHLLMMWKRV